jgi:hypothetical protein
MKSRKASAGKGQSPKKTAKKAAKKAAKKSPVKPLRGFPPPPTKGVKKQG